MTTLLEQFKTTIISIRDILRKGGITGMDSMKHCTLYITARYMSAERCAQFGIPVKFAWETILETSRKKGVYIQVSRDSIYNVGGVDCLVNHFDTLFKTTEFLFRVEAAEHVEIMEKLAPIELDTIHLETDLLGWVYEQHLKKGSSSARDLGQFFTDRSITNYMTILCKPKRSETICDPTMGTGGFLTSALHHLQTVEKLTDAEIRAAKDKFHGFDIDKFVSSVASINMFIESHGNVFPNILFRDSLAKGAIVPYDVILANMPFGVKGLTYARCHESVKALHLDGTKSEPLFLQWMMVSLNVGGRCAVVVPDGMLINNSKCHNETRKYLLNNFELKRVIKMKGQFFMNTGIQPSILFFEKTGKPTTTIEFWNTEKNADGTIKEELILSVARTALDELYSFDMRRYQTMDAVKNPAGFLMVKLEDICNYTNGKTLASSAKIEDGEYDVMGGGMDYIGKTNSFNREGETISISKSGASAGFIAYHNKKYWAGDCLTITPINSKKLNIKFLYYYLKLNNHLTMSKTSGSTIPHCKWDDIKNIQIPLSPFSIQEKIVEDLDIIYQNADFAKKIAESMKQQMTAVMLSISARGFERKKLGDIVTIESGKYITKKEAVENGFKIYGGGDACDYYSTTSNRNDRLVVAKDGVSLKCVRWIYGEFHLNHHGWTLKCSETIYEKYLYYYLSTKQDQIYDLASGSAQKGINQKTMEQFEVEIPPLPVQTEILAILNEMDAELKTLEQMATKAETRAQFILDGYLSISVETPVEEASVAYEPISNVLTILEDTPDYKSMTRAQLVEVCKKNNLKGITTKKKEDLLKMIESL
jgi:restriction endonuclease S subunit